MTDSLQLSRRSDLRDILALGVPAMLAQASQPLLNIGETARVGRLSAEALAARAIGAAIAGTVYWIFAFLTFGTTSLIGHHYGAKETKACSETYFHALFLALVGGLLIACGGAVFAQPLYRLMGADTTVAVQGADYFRSYILSAPLTLMIYCSVGFHGFMKRLAFWTGALLVVFSVLVWAQSPSPKPDPELKKLGVLVGHWTYEGEYKAGPGGPNGKAKGEDKIQWILDGYFLQEQLAETGPMGDTRSILIYGYDPANKNITWSGRGSDGGGGSSTIKVNGNTITYDGKWSMAGQEIFARVTLIVSADSMNFEEKVSADGRAWAPFFEARFTRVKPAPKME